MAGSSPDGTPFKASVNKNPCVVTVGDGSVSIEFSEFQKSVDITYDRIRCLQQWKGKVLINAQVDGGLFLFLIEQKKAKKIHDMIASHAQKS